MGRNKVILVDADVISHFMATGYIDRLTEILQPHAVMIVENVYKEASYHPTEPDRKRKVDKWMERCKVCKIAFPYANENIRREFFRLKKENPMLGTENGLVCRWRVLDRRLSQVVTFGMWLLIVMRMALNILERWMC